MTVARSDWKPRRLDELGFVGRGKSRHRPRNDGRLYGGPFPFIQTADVMNADPYITDYSQTYTEFGLQQSKLWPPYTLCMTIAGANTAKTAILKFEACFPDSIVGFIPDEKKADLHFVKYSLDLMKHKFLAVTRGATQDNLSLEKLLSFPIPTPSLSVQRRIAGILSAYDDLIENNQRRIKILEEMARTLYREWFINLRFPGHQKVPLVDSPLGPIPKGWEVKKLGEILELKYGKALKQEDRREGSVPVFGSSGTVGHHDTALAQGPGIIVGRKGNVGSVFWSSVDFYPIDTVYFVTSKLPLRFLFYELQTKNFINNDAAVPGLNRNQAYSLEMAVPPCELLAWFCRFADDFEQQAAVLSRQNETLRRTRDLVLLRLLSGQVEVKNEKNTNNKERQWIENDC